MPRKTQTTSKQTKTTKAPVAKKTPVKKQSTKQATKSVAKKTEQQEAAVPVAQVANKKRFFQIVNADGETEGRFAGHKPKQAANKAFTSLLKKQTGGGKGPSGKIEFSIIECTRNSKRKVYNYIGERVELETPEKVKIQDKEIVYKFNNVLKKNPAKPQVGGKKQVAKTTKKEEVVVEEAKVEEVAKASPVKKAPAKKAPTKKAPAKKAPVKKAPAKKAVSSA